ncbi:MAG: DUF87 domain-containing protein [Acidobacteriota bacterium]
MADFEKLGAFYLGKRHEVEQGETTDELLLYDSRDLTTHAVCVGMTGSGKTGLCVTLIEEAAIDGIPAILIDPKGDLGNLLLQFPGLSAQEFRPWIDEDEATRKGRTPDEHAKATAKLWRDGLKSWGQDGDRIRRLQNAASIEIYTPGSQGGRPLQVLRSFDAPPPAVMQDGDALRDRIQGAVSGLLTLIGLNADPLQSREHVFLSSLLDHHWRQGKGLSLAQLIRQVQAPPFEQVGVFDLESFFPAGDRMSLALRLNNVLASPGFASWMKGEPLDVNRLLHGEDGRPKISILSIAHLNDSERMFFVTTLLNEVVAWMRAQQGSSSLRALLYLDEVFGYLPPTANPPSKQPMLTLLKQARAFGLGVVLATQNPVDLDYKALSNAGTWFLGRLQTERDKMRVLDGLEGAALGEGFDRAAMERTLAGLSSRVFLMHDVHEDGPVTFHVRWAMSYLRGPMSRGQLNSLCRRDVAAAAGSAAKGKKKAAAPATVGVAAPVVGTVSEPAPAESAIPDDRPTPPVEADEIFIQPDDALPPGSRLVYRPALLASAELHFANRSGLDEWQRVQLLAKPPTGRSSRVDWSEARRLTNEPDLAREPEGAGRFETLSGAATKAKSYASWKKALVAALYRDEAMTTWKSKPYKLVSEPGESEGDFRARVAVAAREKRDVAIGKLRRKYAPKLDRLQDRIRRAEEKVERESDQAKHAALNTAVSIGATVLGAIFGRKKLGVGTMRRAGTAVRGASRTARQRGDIAHAQAELENLQGDLETMEAQFQDELSVLEEAIVPAELDLQEVRTRPRKSDLRVDSLQLAWTPWGVSSEGIAEPLF